MHVIALINRSTKEMYSDPLLILKWWRQQLSYKCNAFRENDTCIYMYN